MIFCSRLNFQKIVQKNKKIKKLTVFTLKKRFMYAKIDIRRKLDVCFDFESRIVLLLMEEF